MPLVGLLLLILLWDELGLEGLIVGNLVGAVISLLIVAAAMIVRRIAPRPSLFARGVGLRALARHAAPLTLSRGLIQVNGFADRAITSLILAGGISALRYGDSLVRLPFGAIRPAYQTAIYPTLVQASRDTEAGTLGTTTERLIRYGLVFFVPLAGLTIAVAPLATAILYDRGSFTSEDLILTSQIVAVAAPLIVMWTVQPVLTSALNAERKGAVLLGGGVITIVVNLSLDVILGSVIGVAGIAMATVVTSIIVVLFMGHRLKRADPAFSTSEIWTTLFKSVLAVLPPALILGLPIWSGWVGSGLPLRILVLVLVGIAGLLAYYLVARRLGVREADVILRFGLDTSRRMLRRFRRSS